MHSAAYCEDVKILKRLKPDPQRDDVGEMLRSAARFGHLDVVKYLIEDLGAQPNDKPNGGSTALDACLTSFGFAAITARIRSGWGSWKTKASKYDVSKCLDTIRVLVEAGAQWTPVDARAINDVRRNLLDCDAEVALEVIDLLMKHNACTRETIDALLKTPAIKAHVAEIQRKLDRLGFDVRTKEQKEKEDQQKAQYRRWALNDLMKRYPREKIYEEIWTEPMIKVAKRYPFTSGTSRSPPPCFFGTFTFRVTGIASSRSRISARPHRSRSVTTTAFLETGRGFTCGHTPAYSCYLPLERAPVPRRA